MAAAVTTGCWAAAERLLAGRDQANSRWCRSNYAGRPVSLAGGPGLVAGAMSGAAFAGSGCRLPLLIGGVGAVGLYDDLYGVTHARGLLGHLRQLRHGQVTTGLVKLATITTLALVCAPHRPQRPSRVLDGLLIAVMANLVNLFDLRPGRAVKVAAILVTPLVGYRGGAGTAAAAVLSAATAAGVPDLQERTMLGDCGANALGAAAGWLWAAGRQPAQRALLLAAAIGLTLASERHSFSAVIDSRPVLRRIDRLGRRH